jgi:hypothetical protein
MEYRYGNRRLQVSSDECFCPVESTEFRAPSEHKFKVIYDDIIQFLQAEGKVTTITGIVKVWDRGNTIALTPSRNCPAITFVPGLDQSMQSGQSGTYVLYDFLNLQEGMAGVCNESGECVAAP